ncbi:MAG: hypothetical protein M0R17_02990 [Candidatus Omnitrophica bacterium]|jgi:DNA polymerase elongation subunit (family B)|nr:hypothetical protein [Candidatus Omnitrophota bacterium]
MKVPISVYPVDDGILVYRNNQIDKAPFPFKPFVLAETSKFSTVFGPKEIWRKVPEDELTEYTRLEFNTIKDSLDFKKRHVKQSNSFLFNNYIEQVYISNQDFFLAYPHTKDLVVLFFDIEVASKGDGLFPKAHTNPILCVGYSIWIYDHEGKKRKVHHEICKGFNSDTLDDKIVIDNFLDCVQKWNPDIIAGFNSSEFDMPYLVERAQMSSCDLTKLCRGGREPTIGSGDNKIRIPGRIHFDIYLSNAGVQKDQTLYNLKSKGLKEVSRWYKIKKTFLKDSVWIEAPMEDIELKEHIENLLQLFKDDENKLYQYLDDDIYRTEGVGHVYIRNCITLAEMMHTSLDSIMGMYSSFVPKLLLARNMQQRRLINTETNFSKYNIETGTVAKLSDELKFEGAISELYQDGYFPAVYKLDFSAQYPSAIQSFNLGPDTTKLIKVEEYTGRYECKSDDKYNWYRIPTEFDKGKLKYDFIVRVKNNENGFLKQEITRLKAERKKIRDEIKNVDDDKKISLQAQQNAIKIINNSIYGSLGLKTSIYGDMISAVMVTSLCRWCTLKIMQRNKSLLIEVDTDGLIFTNPLDASIENAWLNVEIKKKFNIIDNFMTLESESKGDRAYFYLAKNYILETTPGKYTIHGSSFKSSQKAFVVDRAIKLGIDYIFNNKPIDEIIDEAYNFKDLTLDDFVERIKLTKEEIDYSDKLNKTLFLAKQVEKKTGQILTEGAQINYVLAKKQLDDLEFKQYYRTEKNYTYINYVSDISEIDLKYYEGLIDKALAKFGISKVAYIKTDLFNPEPSKKPIKNKKQKLDVVYMGDL